MRLLRENLKSQRLMGGGFLLVPVILGLYLRAQTLKWHRLFAYDPYYFYRVATHIAQGGSIFDRDPMIVTLSRRFIDDEPGLPLIWGYLSRITHVDTWTLGIYLPLIIFVLEVLMLYKLAKDAFNWRVGILSALFLAVLPGHIYRSHAGGIWKDTLGSLFMLMFLHAVILITKSRKLDGNKIVKYGVYLVSSLYLSAFTFDGFGIFPGAVSLYLLILPLFKKPRRNEFFIAASMVISLILAYFTIPTYHREQYALLPFLFVAVASLIVLWVGYYLDSAPGGKLFYGAVLAVFSLVALYFLLFNPPGFLDRISKMAWMLILPTKYGLSAQSRPNTLRLLFNTWFSVSLIISALGVVYLLKDTKKRENLLVLSWFFLSLFLGTSTVRLTFVMSFSVAVMSALGVELVYTVLLRKLDFRKAVSISLIVLLIGIVPTFQAGKEYVSMAPVPPDYWLDALQWMHDNINGSVVFNWWDWGYWLEAYGVKTVGDNGYQSALSSAHYANILLSNYSDFQYWINRYSKIVNIRSLTLIRNNQNITVDYLLISPEILFFKFGALTHAYDALVEIYHYHPNEVRLMVLHQLYVSDSITIYRNSDMILEITNNGKAYLSVENSPIAVRDVVFDNPGPNKIIHLSSRGVIVYINGPYAAIFNEKSFNSTLVQLVVYENQSYSSIIFENSFVKIYVVP